MFLVMYQSQSPPNIIYGIQFTCPLDKIVFTYFLNISVNCWFEQSSMARVLKAWSPKNMLMALEGRNLIQLWYLEWGLLGSDWVGMGSLITVTLQGQVSVFLFCYVTLHCLGILPARKTSSEAKSMRPPQPQAQ